jgi:hypothetical protein
LSSDYDGSQQQAGASKSKLHNDESMIGVMFFGKYKEAEILRNWKNGKIKKT